MYTRDRFRARVEESAGRSHGSPSITSQATASPREITVATVSGHHDRELANSHTMELIVANGTGVLAAASADFSPGPCSQKPFASTTLSEQPSGHLGRLQNGWRITGGGS